MSDFEGRSFTQLRYEIEYKEIDWSRCTFRESKEYALNHMKGLAWSPTEYRLVDLGNDKYTVEYRDHFWQRCDFETTDKQEAIEMMYDMRDKRAKGIETRLIEITEKIVC